MLLPTPQAVYMDTGVVSDASGVISDAERHAISPGPGMPSLSAPLPSLSSSSNPWCTTPRSVAPSVSLSSHYPTLTATTPTGYLCPVRAILHQRKLFFARVRHQEDKFCFFLIMKKNIPVFSDLLVVFQHSCDVLRYI